MSLAQRIVDRSLENAFIFEVQQRLCNNYSGILEEFSGILGRKGIRVLDVGCSTGTCAGQIIDMKANSYTGVDVSQKYIEIAKRRYADGHFVAMDARRMSFADATFDVAMFVGVLHHMDDALARDCLRDVSRVVKPDGHVVVAEPVFTDGMYLSTFFLSLDRGRHIRSEEGYRSLFGDFAIQRQRYFRFSAHRFCSYILTPAPRRIATQGSVQPLL
jgi:2-polyprenyl-3-methyl-5-hydroxy-6-metoxy-1,4-benzoquinol methylase